MIFFNRVLAIFTVGPGIEHIQHHARSLAFYTEFWTLCPVFVPSRLSRSSINFGLAQMGTLASVTYLPIKFTFGGFQTLGEGYRYGE
jgi:hypothetical protein